MPRARHIDYLIYPACYRLFLVRSGIGYTKHIGSAPSPMMKTLAITLLWILGWFILTLYVMP